MKKRVIYTVILLFTCVSAMAQIKIADNNFFIGRNEVISHSGDSCVEIRGYNGMLWRVYNGNFLKLDLRTDETRFSGSGDCVNFYDADLNRYITVFVRKIVNLSDERLKEEIHPYGQTPLMSLNPVSFRDNSGLQRSAAASVTSENISPSNVHYGFIAEELQQLFPEAVQDDGNGNLMINYIAIIPMLVKSLQEIEARINEQSQEIESLLTEQSIYSANETSNHKQ